MNEQTEGRPCSLSVEIGMEPGPGRREHEDEKNRAQRKDNERHRHYPRTFVRMEHRLEVRVPSGTKKNVDYLPSHVERGEDDAAEHQVVRQGRNGPMRRAVQDFFLRPAA